MRLGKPSQANQVEQIRAERPEDAGTIRYVLEHAFVSGNEADLVELLRSADKAAVSLVAVVSERVVGHILFSEVSIGPGGSRYRGIGLAPVAVLTEFQNRGIGSRLIRRGLEECRNGGYHVAVVLGDPSFYVRFGFSRASGYGLNNEYGVDDAFMAIELTKGALMEVGGVVRYPPEFREAGC